MAVPAASTLKVQIYVAHGSSLGSEAVLLNFSESSSTEGNRKLLLAKEYAASATDQSVDLSTFLNTATWIFVKEQSGVGVKVGLASGGTKAQIAANGVWGYKNGTATPPTLYFDNVSATDACFIEITVLGASA